MLGSTSFSAPPPATIFALASFFFFLTLSVAGVELVEMKGCFSQHQSGLASGQ